MSTTIDERVLEMRFDNRHFENNVSNTMSTLDKLKQKLNFTGASKGLDSVNAAAKNVNMTGLGNAVETVSAKFSALQVMGVTALANITNSAVNAGKRIVSALTIDPVKTGLSEYETKMNAIQVIQANTRGKNTMADITAALEDLNKYADNTIYNFAQMTSNVGKFTAQGYKVEDAANAVKGLANLAAASGASAEDMARATYQMSQALGGTIRLMDWNSLRNANMATQDLKNTLIDLAKVNGIAIDDMIKKHGTFEQTLSEGWLSGKMFTEAMNIYSGIYSDAELKAKGFSDSQIANFKDLAAMAASAATEVKTFTQLWDVLKETAQSGWTQTWELIFGDFDASKQLFTGLQNYFSGIINGWSDARNTLLKNVLRPSDFIEGIFGKLGKLGKIPGLEQFTEITEKVTDFSGKLEEFQEVVSKVWRGDYQNGAARRDLLTEAGYNPAVIQELVNKGHGYKLTVEDIEAAHARLGITLTESAESTEKVTLSLSELSDEQLKNAGLTDDEIRLYRDLQKEAKRTGRSVEELVTAMSERSGRDLLIQSVKNAWTGLVNILSAVKDAWYDIFSPISAVRIYTIIESIEAFSQHLRDNEEVAEKIGKTFRGVFAALDIAVTVLSGPFKFLIKIVSGVLKKLGVSFLDITAKIGDGIVALRDGIDSVIGSISAFIADHVSRWIDKFKETEIFKTVSEWFQEAGDAISDAVENISDKIKEFDASNLMDTLRIFGTFLSGIGSNIANSDTFMFIVDSVCAAFGKLKDFFGRFKLPKFNLDNFKFYTNILEKFDGVNDAGGALSAFGSWLKGNSITKAKTKFQEIFSMDWETFKATALTKFTSFWMSAGDKIKAGLEKCKEVLKSVGEFIFGTEDINLPAILDLAQKFLGVVVLIKTLQLLNTLASPFDNITDAFNNLTASVKWNAVGGAFKAMAIALGALTACIIILASMPDMDKAWEATKMLGLMLGAMAVVIAGLMFMATKMPKDDVVDIVGVSLSILALVGAIYLLTEVLERIDGLTLKDPGRTFVSLGLLLLGLAAGVKIVAAAGSSSFKSVAAILTLVAALKMLLDVITAYDDYDWTDKGDAILRVAGMLILLSTAINIASRGVKSNAGASGLAMLLLAMVFSLKILLDVIVEFAKIPKEDLIKGGGVVIALLAAMSAMMMGIGMVNQGHVLEKGQKSVNNFVGLATALLAVVAAIWLLGKMPMDVLIQGGLAVTGALLLFTFMLKQIGNSCSGVKTGAIVAMLFFMGVLIAEIAMIMRRMEDVPWQSSLSTAAALSGVLLAMSAAFRIMTKTDIKAGVIIKWVGAMVALGGIIAILAYVLRELKGLDPATAIGNATALSGLLVTMAYAMLTLTKYDVSSGNLYKWIGAMAVLSMVIGGLAFVLYSVKSMNPANAIGNATALSLVLIAMAGVLNILSNVKIDVTNVTAWIGAMAGLSLVVSALAFILYSIKEMDPKSAIGNAIALGILVGVLSVSLIPIAAASKITKDSSLLTGVVALAGLMAALRIAVWVLASMEGLQNARENAITLSELALALSLCMPLIAVAGMTGWGAIVGVVALAGLMAALRIAVWVLASMEGLQNARENAITLALLATALTECLLPLSIISTLVYPALVAVGALALMILSLKGVVKVLTAMEGLENARANAETIIMLMDALASVVLSIGSLGLNALVAVAAISGIVILVSKLGILATAVGWLADHMSGLEGFIESGMDLLKKLARGLGEIVSEFGVGVSSGLPEIAANISKFAGNLLPFIVTMSLIKDDVVDRAKNLVSTILVLIGADFINRINDFLGGSLSDFGTELSNFAENMGGFCSAISEFKPETVACVETLCSAIRTLVDANLKDAWTQLIPGDNSLGGLGENMATFIESIKTALSGLDGFQFDHQTFDEVIGAAERLSTLQSSLDSIGGVVSWFTGRDDLGTFGTNVAAFITSMKTALSGLDGFQFDHQTFDEIIAAAQDLAGLQASLEPIGGVISWFTGRDDLGTFGTNVAAFISSMKTALATLDGAALNEEALASVMTAAETLAGFQSSLEPMGGVIAWFNGRDDLGTFGENVSVFADAMAKLKDAMGENGISEDAITSMTNTGNALVALIDVLPEEGWFDGKMDLTEFSDYITDFATALSGFASTAAEIDATAVSTAINTAYRIKNLISGLVGLDTSGLAAFTGIGTGGIGADGAAYKIAQAISKYSEEVAGIDTAAVSTSVTAATKLKSLITGLVGLDTSGIENFKIASIGTAMKGYADKVSGIDTGVVAQSVTSANRLKTFIGSLAGLDTSGIGNFRVASIGTAMKSYSSNVSGLDAAAVSSSISAANKLKSFISSLTGLDTSGVSSFKSAINEMTTVDVAGFVSTMSSMVSDIATAISSNVGKVSDAAKAVVKEALSAVKGKNDEFKAAGKTLATHLANGIKDGKAQGKASGAAVAADAVTGVRSKYSSMKSAGSYLVDGFAAGITERTWRAEAKARSMAKAAEKAAKEELGINSPSRVFREIGMGVPEGFALGVEKYSGLVDDSVVEMADSAIDSVGNTISKLASVISTDIDSQPTIRPVLDLTDVRSGVASMGSLFDTGSQIGVMANLRTVGAMMNGYGQNGGNNDVVSAIDKLRKDLGNISGDSYSVGNITYDDGSNIADAVKTIARAAKMERRI